MMSSVLVVATCSIRHNIHGRFEATGRFDRQGNMIMRAKDEIIAPDTVFEMAADDIELERLRQHGAIRNATESETALWERKR
jgi:hypothetical protein